MQRYARLNLFIILIFLLGCSRDEINSVEREFHPDFRFTNESFHHFVYEATEHPDEREALLHNPAEFLSLAQDLLKGDEQLMLLVDKEHHLSFDYYPSDLVLLDGLAWASLSRNGHMVTRATMHALEAMSLSAREDGITLLVGSAYRSYQRQQEVYAGWVRQLGQEEADRLSARPGTSQHQLGTVVDFVPINASFTGTPAQRWLVANAHYYGFSLSYPDGYEAETGYAYESWHYRYLGRTALVMQQQFFRDLQHRLLLFWHYHAHQLRDHWRQGY